MLQEGVNAPEFQLADVSGQERSLRHIVTDGPTVFAFFKISCPVCQFALPFLDRLTAGSIRIVGISQDDAAPTERFQEEFGLKFPSLIDEEGAGFAVSNAFGITHVPTMFLVESDGRVSWALDGFSKKEFERLGERAGVAPFREGEPVPDWKGG